MIFIFISLVICLSIQSGHDYGNMLKLDTLLLPWIKSSCPEENLTQKTNILTKKISSNIYKYEAKIWLKERKISSALKKNQRR